MLHTHHIIPKHAGGTDDPSNLVQLTVEEHAQAHKVLFEKYGRLEDELAWKGLAGLMTKQEIVKRQLSSAGKKGGAARKGMKGIGTEGAKANWEKNREKLTEVLRNNAKLYGHLGGYKAGLYMWINNGIETKKVKKADGIPEGWERGRHSRSN